MSSAGREEFLRVLFLELDIVELRQVFCAIRSCAHCFARPHTYPTPIPPPLRPPQGPSKHLPDSALTTSVRDVYVHSHPLQTSKGIPDLRKRFEDEDMIRAAADHLDCGKAEGNDDDDPHGGTGAAAGAGPFESGTRDEQTSQHLKPGHQDEIPPSPPTLPIHSAKPAAQTWNATNPFSWATDKPRATIPRRMSRQPFLDAIHHPPVPFDVLCTLSEQRYGEMDKMKKQEDLGSQRREREQASQSRIRSLVLFSIYRVTSGNDEHERGHADKRTR